MLLCTRDCFHLPVKLLVTNLNAKKAIPTVNTVAVTPLAQVKTPPEIPQLPLEDLRVKPLPDGVAVSINCLVSSWDAYLRAEY